MNNSVKPNSGLSRMWGDFWRLRWWVGGLSARSVDTGFALLFLGMLAYTIFAFWGITYDDVYLAFQYAKNVEAGHGFVFNVGEQVLGTPAPLFVILLVAVHKILPFLTLPQVGSVISGAGLSVTALALYGIGRRINQRWVGLLAAALTVFNPFTMMTLGGETPLYLAFIVLATYWFVSERFGLTAFILGLALMNRTEALVPIALFAVLYLWDKRQFPVKMALVGAATVTPWAAYATWHFGTVLTQSFPAKVAQVDAGAGRYLIDMWDWVVRVILAWDGRLENALPLLILGGISLVFAARPWRILVGWTVLQTALYSALPIPFYHWYMAQVGVGAAILIALAVVELPQILGRTASGLAEGGHSRLARQWRGVQIGAAALVVLAFAPTAYGLAHTTHIYQQTQSTNPANLLYEQVSDWLSANTPPNTRIAYLEIGRIGFKVDRYIIDTLGLVTAGVYERVAQGDMNWSYLRYKPDIIIYNPFFQDGWTGSGSMLRENWFLTGFQPVAHVSQPGYPAILTIYQRQPDAQIPDPVRLDLVQEWTDQPVGELVGAQSIHQRFTPNCERPAAVEVKLATYARSNSGRLLVDVLDPTDEIIGTWQVDVTTLLDNQWRRFFLPLVEPSNGLPDGPFTLTLRAPDATPGNAVTAWQSLENNNIRIGDLTMDGKALPGALALRTYCPPTLPE